MRQDAVILNLQRACEQSIDLANHLARIKELGIPQNSRQAFELLAGAGIIEDGLSKGLGAMAGFRNIAVHNYTKLDLAVVKAIIETRLPTFLEFTRIALGYA